MKYVCTLLLSLYNLFAFSQSNATAKKHNNKVSFVTIVDIARATKDGIYMNEYVVNIPYEQAKKLNGKKIRVSGKVTIEKGIKNNDTGEIRQGRDKDTKHIESPKIEVLKE